MRRRTLNVPLMAVIVLLVVVAPAAIAVLSIDSGANFADHEMFTGNRLGAGSVDVAIDDVVEIVGADPTNRVEAGDPTVFSATNLAPGDHVTGALAVNNNGTLPLRFWVTATATTSSGTLGDWLLFDGWVASDCRRGPAAAERIFTTNVVLGPTAARLIGRSGSSDGSVQELRLEPGDDLVVCVGAHLPLAAPNDVQSATVEVELIVSAEQAVEDNQ